MLESSKATYYNQNHQIQFLQNKMAPKPEITLKYLLRTFDCIDYFLKKVNFEINLLGTRQYINICLVQGCICQMCTMAIGQYLTK